MCPKSRSNFTILEILAVVSVIAFLAAMTAGLFTYVSRKNRDARSLATVEMLRTGLEQYKEKYGFYPPTIGIQSAGYIQFHLDKVDTGSAHAREKVPNNFNQFIDYNHLSQPDNSDLINGTYHIKDGFGRPIYYRCPGYVNKTAYDLGSLGSDGKFGDGNAAAANTSTAGEHFGKGDDITNCRR